MNALFRLFRRNDTASVARGRLQALMLDERAAANDSHVRQMELLREELVAVITRHIGRRIA